MYGVWSIFVLGSELLTKFCMAVSNLSEVRGIFRCLRSLCSVIEEFFWFTAAACNLVGVVALFFDTNSATVPNSY